MVNVKRVVASAIGISLLIFVGVIGVSESNDDDIYGCYLENNEVFWDGNAHYASWGVGPNGMEGFAMLIGDECDEYPSRFDYNNRTWSPNYVMPKPIEPTPVPTPKPTSTPVPVNPGETEIIVESQNIPEYTTCKWILLMHTYDSRGYYNVVEESDWMEC